MRLPRWLLRFGFRLLYNEPHHDRHEGLTVSVSRWGVCS
jgi:hypothetical protein